MKSSTQIDADRVVREYAKIEFADLGMFVDWGEDGVTIRSSTDLSPDLRAAVIEVTETKAEHGGTGEVQAARQAAGAR